MVVEQTNSRRKKPAGNNKSETDRVSYRKAEVGQRLCYISLHGLSSYVLLTTVQDSWFPFFALSLHPTLHLPHSKSFSPLPTLHSPAFPSSLIHSATASRPTHSLWERSCQISLLIVSYAYSFYFIQISSPIECQQATFVFH